MTSGGEGALYVYAFIRAGEPFEILAPPVDGDAQVTTLPMGEIAAVVSPIAVEEFQGPEAEARLEDPDWMTERALRHEAVVEEVMHARPLLPLTFGVVFSRERALSEAVEPHEREIAAFIDSIADKEEWAFKVYADKGKLRERVGRSERFRALLGALPESPGARYFHEKRLQRELDRLAEAERADRIESIRQELLPIAEGSKALRLLSREMTGRQEDMVMNAAFLVAAGRVEDFHRRIRELEETHGPWGLTIEATGPWPPYNFCPGLQVQQ